MKKLAELREPVLIGIILILNLAIYVRAPFGIEPTDTVFAECARNSGRISAAINLILLFMLGHFGLKHIYREEPKKKVFLKLILLFAINHLIHFLFVYQNFRPELSGLSISHNPQGFITLSSIVLLPLVLAKFKKLNGVLHTLIIAHFFNVTHFISKTFYGRYKPEDPAYLHRIGILIMMAALAYVLYRAYRERRQPYKVAP